MPSPPITILPLGDSAMRVAWPQVRSDEAFGTVHALARRIERERIHGVTGVVPAFDSLTVHYNACVGAWTEIEQAIHRVASEQGDGFDPPARLVEIPVCYDDEFGPDFADLAAAHALTRQQAIELHASGDYLVRMIGFAPGFPYLSGLPPPLHMPRRPVPRESVPAGSVAIGGNQTGIYSLTTPGGWHIIGRTPLALFLPHADPPCLLAAGDRVRFQPISKNEFQRLRDLP